MLNGHSNSPDVGVDLELSKKALTTWLLQHGRVARRHAHLGRKLKEFARTDSAAEECAALFILVSHQFLHPHEAANDGDTERPDAPCCTSRPCKTVAVGEVLREVYKCATDHSGHWARLANSLEPIVVAFEALNLAELEKQANALQELEQAVPAQPEYDNHFSLLPTVDPADLFARLMLRHPAFGDQEAAEADVMKRALAPCSLVAAIYGALGMQVFEMLSGAIDLAVKLRAQLRTMVPSHTLKDRRPGRPRHDWLNQRRRTLREAGFSEPKIAEFLPKEPLRTEQQRRYATERVRKGVRGARTTPKGALKAGATRPTSQS
jgi:hypothetical protein